MIHALLLSLLPAAGPALLQEPAPAPAPAPEAERPERPGRDRVRDRVRDRRRGGEDAPPSDGARSRRDGRLGAVLLVRRAFGDGAPRGQWTKAHAHRAFAAMDANGDGLVTADEVVLPEPPPRPEGGGPRGERPPRPRVEGPKGDRPPRPQADGPKDGPKGERPSRPQSDRPRDGRPPRPEADGRRPPRPEGRKDGERPAPGTVVVRLLDRNGDQAVDLAELDAFYERFQARLAELQERRARDGGSGRDFGPEREGRRRLRDRDRGERGADRDERGEAPPPAPAPAPRDANGR